MLYPMSPKSPPPSPKPVPERVVLWDVDGTLVHTAGVGSEVFDEAINKALGRLPSERVRMGGKTDPQIVGEYLEMMGVGPDEQAGHVRAILAHLEAGLAAEASRITSDGHPMPGVPEVLRRLASDPKVISTLLTGNVAPNAVVKLAAFGLDHWVDFEAGAYGSDHADREQLVPVALDRIRRLQGVEIAPDDTWVVGDTPRDLACARAGGARCLLVGTGSVSVAELRKLDADEVLDDLADVDRVIKILMS